MKANLSAERKAERMAVMLDHLKVAMMAGLKVELTVELMGNLTAVRWVGK